MKTWIRIYLKIPSGDIITMGIPSIVLAGSISLQYNQFVCFSVLLNRIKQFVSLQLISKQNIRNMAESVYKPRQCAFHPKQIIFNFCRNQDCLLPLCPTCVDVHSEQHKQEKTYGKFQNIHQVVNDLTFSMDNSIKQLDNFAEEIKEQLNEKGLDEQQLRRQIADAKQRVLGLVQRFFTDFEKQVNKSILEFNVSMKQSYREMQNTISTMKSDLTCKISSLATEKVLKTIIAYHSKEEDKKIQSNLTVLRQTLDLCGGKRAGLMIDNNSIQKMVNQLSQFMFLSFENWEQDIKYVADFIKTGFTSNRSQNSSIVNQ